MSKFHVRDTFELPERRLLVLAGSVVEGEIAAGMFVHVPFNPRFGLVECIHAVERLTGDRGAELALCVEADEELAEFWRGINIDDEILEVTTGVEEAA